MAERKTAEVKIRIEPSKKARWQAAADAKGADSLSEYVRDVFDQELWTQENKAIDGTRLLQTAAEHGVLESGLVAKALAEPGTCPAEGGCKECPNPDHCREVRVEVGLEQAEQAVVAEQYGQPVPITPDEPKPWMYRGGDSVG